MTSTYFEIAGDGVTVGVTITEMLDGTLKFDLNVIEDGGITGDLNGLFFDVANDEIVGNLTVTGDDVTGEKFTANSVTKVDNYNNVLGEIVKADGKFDVGVQFGSQGIAADDIQSTTFYLGTKDDSPLTIADVYDQDFAARLTSVGQIGGDRSGSVKIGGNSNGPIVNPEDPEEPSANEAVNDSMTVSNAETFNDGDFPDPLDFLAFSLLENDTTDGTSQYQGYVTAVNDQELLDGLIFEGSAGGQLKVNADGTVDFSANGDFDYLMGDETAMTQFTYTIEGGSTATLDVVVFAQTTGGGGGGDDGLFPF